MDPVNVTVYLSISDGRTAATVLWIVGLTGFTTNIAAILFSLNMKSMRNKFCILFVSTACADCGVLSAFSFWVAPMLYAQSTLSIEREGKAVAGLWILPSWVASVFSTGSVAVNRYIAVSKPTRYNEIYSTRNVVINIIFNWAVGIAYAIPFAFDGCEMYFDPFERYTYHYSDYTTCGRILDGICSAICTVVFVIIFAVNLATFYRLRQHGKKVGDSKMSEDRRRKEISFFIQACLNATIFEVVMVFYHLVNPTTRWPSFIVKTLVWELGHTGNGIIFLAINNDVRHKIMSIISCGKHKQTQHGMSMGQTVVTKAPTIVS